MDAIQGDTNAPGRYTTRLAGSLVAAFVVYRIWIAIYNVYWHPLSKYPGPLLRSAFRLPDSISCLRGVQFLEIEELHRRYGHVVRIAPNNLSYTDPQAWKDIYGLKPGGKSELGKDPDFYRARIGTHILNADQVDHARIRKVMAPVFNDAALYAQEPLLQKYFNLFVSKLQERIGKNESARVDLNSFHVFTTFDIIGDLVLGEPFGALETGFFVSWISNAYNSIKMMGVFRFALNHPAFGAVFALLTKLNPSILANRKAHMKFTEEKINKRISIKTDRPDFIDHVLKHEDEFSHGDILRNSRILLIAGSETTATHLSGALWHLLTNPKTLAAAQNEVRSAFESADQFTLRAVTSVERLPYLTAVVKESFRCYPSVPSILPRVTNPSGNVVAGKFVPGNVSVGIHHWSAYRHPDHFHRPEDFIPERWLPDAPAEFQDDKREVLQPFHIGPRGCLGKSLAYAEIRSTLVRLLWHFEMTLEQDSREWFKEQREYSLWDKQALWVNLARRAF